LEFSTQNTAGSCKHRIVTLAFKKNAIFYENCQKFIHS
jgi:hypothetical protein